MPRSRTSLYSDDYQWMLRRLCELREEAGITQQALAEAMSTSQTNVSKLERGAMRMDLADLLSYLSAIGADPVGFMAEYVRHRS